MRRTRTDKEEDVRMRKRMSRRTEKDKKEEEASKFYLRNIFCPLMSIFVRFLRRRRMRMGRRRTEKELYMRGLRRMRRLRRSTLGGRRRRRG